MQGLTDFRLARRAVIEGFKRGSLDRNEICDANPELLRAAKNIGKACDRPCPICGQDALRQVRYVYGDDLKQLSGRPVYPEGWADQLAAEHDEFRCYSVEVCVECSWNHLAACYLMGRRYAVAGERRRLGRARAGRPR
ncbi:MAG TPA: DUF5318 family protein [Actinomycetota bacterium]|nr:DUF5318 family protein [Actinomycetota bacterium]